MSESSSPPAAADTRVLLPIMAVVLVAFLVIGMALPVLPLHVHQDLGLGAFAVGLVAGSQFAAAVLTRVWAGTFADRRGSRRGVIIGLSAAAFSGVVYLVSLAVAEAPTLSAGILILGRGLLGASESLILTSAVSWGLALVEPGQRGWVIAWVGMAMFAALAVGAPLGTALYALAGFQAIAFATVLAPLATLCLVLRLPGVAPAGSKERPRLASVARTVWMPGVGAALSSIGFGAILAFGSLLFVERGWEPVWLPFTTYAIGLVAARVLFGHLPDKLGGAKVALASIVIEALGLVLIWLASGPVLAAAGAFLTGCGYSLVYPGLGLEAVRRAKPEVQGLVMGIYTVFLDIALGFGTPVLGLIAAASGVEAVFLASAAVVLSASAVALLLIGRPTADTAEPRAG